jgi:hypothetical protein
MQSPSKTQRLLLRYLAGQMSAEERERIDEALITDQEFSDSFAEAKNDWLDAYASGALSPEWKQQVEQTMLNTAEGAASLQVATALNQNRSAMPRKFPSRAALTVFVPALAACLVLAFYLRSNLTSRPQPQHLPAPESSPLASVKPLAPSVSAPAPTHTPSSDKTPVPSGPRHGILALVMPAMTLRGNDSVALPLTPGIEKVQVQWPVPKTETAELYLLVVSRDAATSKEFAQRGAIKTIGGERVATFSIPVSDLSDGESTFALYSGKTREGLPAAQSTVTISHAE